MNEKNKKTGLIRTGAAVPFVIVSALIIVFNIFFLDGLIERSIEYFGGRLNGAEVNVGEVSTSFRDLSVEVKEIEFTNSNLPTHNLFEIGSIKFQMMWDAILRAKIVIDESSINDITVGGQRDSAGEVYPPEEEPTQAVAAQTLSNAKQEFAGNIFGDVANLLSGTDSSEILDEMEGQLKSKQRYEELEKEIDVKEEELKQMLAELPKGKEIDQYDDRVKAINWNDLKDLKKAPGVLKEANDVQKDITSTIKKYDEAQKRVKSEIDYVKQSTKEIEKLVSQDVKALEQKMSLPELDSQSIARILFGAEFVDSLGKYIKYFAMAKEYMPPPKSERQPEVVKKPRGEGRNYQFGTPTSYPMFWLKLAQISSQNEQGDVAGRITDVTTDQGITDKPTQAEVSANFPSQAVLGVKSLVTLDHRQGINDSIELSVASFPVGEKQLSDSDDVTFTMASARAATSARAALVNDQVSLEIKNNFSQIDYTVDASSKMVKELLGVVAADASSVSLDAKASGTLEKLDFSIRSNLGDIIKDALSRHLQQKISEAKRKIQHKVDAQLASHKAKVNQKVAALNDKYMGEIDQAKGKINQLNAQIDGKKNSAGNSLEEKGKDALKSLKKKFKF